MGGISGQAWTSLVATSMKNGSRSPLGSPSYEEGGKLAFTPHSPRRRDKGDDFLS